MGLGSPRWRSSRPRRAHGLRARSSSTRRRPTRATCTRCCTTPPTSRRSEYLRPLLEGRARSCFAMTEPEVAGSDPTGIRTTAVKDGDDWVINGHKWFISRRQGRAFAILIAQTDPDADPPQASNSAFLVDLPADGWEIVRDIDTMAGARQPLRDPDHRPARAGREPARRSRQRSPARAGAPRPGAARALHALDRPDRDGARDARDASGGASAPRRAARRQAGDPVDDGRLGDGAVRREADGAARGVQDRERPAVPAGGELRQAPRGQHALAASSTARSRCTARSATRPTRRSSG